jgi:hypothetical protein
VTSPANAKNCLSVGATQVCEQLRCGAACCSSHDSTVKAHSPAAQPASASLDTRTEAASGAWLLPPLSPPPLPWLQTSGEGMETGAVRYSVWDATATQGQYATTFRVMQADFGSGVAALTAGGVEYPLAVATPLDGCNPLQNEAASIKGAVVLIQRGEPASQRARGLAFVPGRCWGCCCCVAPAAHRCFAQPVHAAHHTWPTQSFRPAPFLSSACSFLPPTPTAGTCYFSEKALHAQDAGAAAVLIYDNELGAYFTFGADQSVGGRGGWPTGLGGQHWVACAIVWVPQWGGRLLLQKCHKAKHAGSAPF